MHRFVCCLKAETAPAQNLHKLLRNRYAPKSIMNGNDLY